VRRFWHPQAGDPDPADVATELAQRGSLLHGGTLISSGTAEAVVEAGSDRTELGCTFVHLRLEARPHGEPDEAEMASALGRAACRSGRSLGHKFPVPPAWYSAAASAMLRGPHGHRTVGIPVPPWVQAQQRPREFGT